MNPFQNLKPASVWNYFYEITQVPRPSKKEEKIKAYLHDFACAFALEILQDEIGNILIKKAATKGKENAPTVILQSHMDMVCEKNADTVFDFENEPLNVYVDGDWVRAKGTTLGGDDGIGMAAQLALLAADDLAHPALECLFTVDEETGLTGAFALKKNFLSGTVLINLDSEDDGEIYLGCAGGVDTLVEFEYEPQPLPQGYEAVKVTLGGLSGGHSGGDIHLNRGNANRILARFLAEEAQKYDLRLSAFDGGNLRNAIPREAYALVLLPAAQEMDFLKHLNDYSLAIKAEYADSDPHLFLKSAACDAPLQLMDAKTQQHFLNALNACPNGVMAMSKTLEGLVKTSSNLASVKMPEPGKIKVVTSQRSSSESDKKSLAQSIRENFEQHGARVRHTDGYPGWSPNLNSRVLKVAQNAFQALHHKEPEVKAIHAGLECGLFLEKYPDLDMISIGPTIKDVHSPDESMNIRTVERFWNWLVEILRAV